MPVPGFSHLRRVTSDCRPWRCGGALGVCRSCASVVKRVDRHWEREVEEIYASYDIFHQSEGSEQLVYAPEDGAARFRSDPLIEKLQRSLPLGERGRLLDVGCGKGAFLAAWSRAFPQWRLEGFELGDATREVVEAIVGVRAMHSGRLDAIDGRFDLVSLVHVLEHVASPAETLRIMRNLLSEDGWLFVEVPHYAERAFDLLVADHCSHLTPETLNRLFISRGFRPAVVSSTWSAKEVSGVFRRAVPDELELPRAPNFPEAFFAVARSIAWLEGTLELADRMRSRASFGVFGTSIGATWLASSVARPIDFFVDEDPYRQGRSHLGKPVLAPGDVPRDATVFMCLPHPQAEYVSNRLTPPQRIWRTLLPPAPL